MKKDNENLYVVKRIFEKAGISLFKGGLICVAIEIFCSAIIDYKNKK